MNDQFIELELRLLILRYGRQKILRALARLGEQTPEQLEHQLSATEEKRGVKKPKTSIVDLVASECRERPEIAEPLQTLAIGFQNRTFLPHLRDVQRFLDRTGTAPGKLRSREAAAPILVRTLANLTRDDLLRLAAEKNSPSESDYAMLARAIMGVPPIKPRTAGEPEQKPPKS